LAQFFILVLEEHKRTDGEDVHPGPEKAVNRLGYRRYNRFVFIEGCIEQHGNARDLFKFLEEFPIEGIHISLYGLKAPCTVAVSYRWDSTVLALPDFVSH